MDKKEEVMKKYMVIAIPLAMALLTLGISANSMAGGGDPGYGQKSSSDPSSAKDAVV